MEGERAPQLPALPCAAPPAHESPWQASTGGTAGQTWAGGKGCWPAHSMVRVMGAPAGQRAQRGAAARQSSSLDTQPLLSFQAITAFLFPLPSQATHRRAGRRGCRRRPRGLRSARSPGAAPAPAAPSLGPIRGCSRCGLQWGGAQWGGPRQPGAVGSMQGGAVIGAKQHRRQRSGDHSTVSAARCAGA